MFALFLRISLTTGVTSDAANNALQAWDMLHGHLLLHGWIIGDATYYTFELPLIAVAEAFFGFHTITVHVALALVYLIVAVCAAALAVAGSHGAARAARAAVAVAVLAAPLLVFSDLWIPIGLPDHTGTAVFLLACCLLIDRVPARRWTAPLLCVILCAGQLGDVTVRYVAVPAIAAVCAYRILAARKLVAGDTANLAAAVVSVPLATAARAAMRHFGSYLMVAPKTGVAPAGQWPRNAALTWHAVRMLFGQVTAPGHSPAGAAAIFGAACLLAAGAGVLRVLWRWRTASRAEQVLAAAIAANLGVYVISTLPSPNTPHDIAAVLPCGAILAARALVPARIAGQADRPGRGRHRHGRRAASAVGDGGGAYSALGPADRVAAGARAALRARRLLGRLGGHPAVRQPGPGPHGRGEGPQDHPVPVGDGHSVVRVLAALREFRHHRPQRQRPRPGRRADLRQAGRQPPDRAAGMS